MNKSRSPIRDSKTLVLCEESDPCCPIVSISSDHIDICDDEGGSVRLTKKQYRILVEKSAQILSNED